MKTLIDCPDCKGKDIEDDSQCPTCDGTGKVEKGTKSWIQKLFEL